MSDNSIFFVPRNPLFCPSKLQLEKIKSTKVVKNASSVQFHALQYVNFFDCGSNFDTIHCPVCQATVSYSWWQASMNRDFDELTGFRLSTYELPCCMSSLNLNDLIYRFQQAFGCFAVELNNIDSDTVIEYRRQCEEIFGEKFKIIYRHI